MHIFRETNTFTFNATIDGSNASINYIFVSKGFRNRNIARQLVNDFINKAEKLGVKSIKLDAYFETLGFWEKWFTINPKAQIKDNYIQDYHDGVLYL